MQKADALIYCPFVRLCFVLSFVRSVGRYVCAEKCMHFHLQQSTQTNELFSAHTRLHIRPQRAAEIHNGIYSCVHNLFYFAADAGDVCAIAFGERFQRSVQPTASSAGVVD
jgi:hypothetical protein